MDLSKFDLTGKTALVTGGGRGIGKSICLALAQAGANVAAADVNAVNAQSIAEEIRAIGKKALIIATDVCVADQVQSTVNQVVEEFGTIDILVNNAGGHKPQHWVSALEIDEIIFRSAVGLGLKSAFFCSQAAAKVMMDHKSGSIINLASPPTYGPCPPQILYSAAKAGVINLTQSMAALLGPHHIRVNAVAPGATATEETSGLFAQAHREVIPLGRFGSPEDIAWAVVFLASDAAAYISGQTLRVDGATIINERSYLDSSGK